MTSSRLPGKVLMDICGKPVLELMIERVRKIDLLDGIVIATTTNSSDEPVVELANSLGVSVFRGSEQDVLKRVNDAANSADADVVVELTGDCPLVDPEISTQVIETYLANGLEYVSTGHHPRSEDHYYLTYPAGMDTQVFSSKVLATANSEAVSPAHREHVPWYMLESNRFSWAVLPAPEHLRRPDLNLSLDTADDFALIQDVFENLYPKSPDFGLSEILCFLDGAKQS